MKVFDKLELATCKPSNLIYSQKLDPKIILKIKAMDIDFIFDLISQKLVEIQLLDLDLLDISFGNTEFRQYSN
jgi:hypothetical protein